MEGDDGLIVLGVDRPAERKRRAAETYATSLRPSTEGSAPLFPQGGTVPEPLLDGLYDGLHVVRFRQAPGSRSALHTHDCDQVLIVTAGHPYIATPDETVQLRAGSVVLVPADEAHIHGASEESGTETVVMTRTGHSTDFVS